MRTLTITPPPNTTNANAMQRVTSSFSGHGRSKRRLSSRGTSGEIASPREAYSRMGRASAASLSFIASPWRNHLRRQLRPDIFQDARQRHHLRLRGLPGLDLDFSLLQSAIADIDAHGE